MSCKVPSDYCCYMLYCESGHSPSYFNTMRLICHVPMWPIWHWEHLIFAFRVCLVECQILPYQNLTHFDHVLNLISNSSEQWIWHILTTFDRVPYLFSRFFFIFDVPNTSHQCLFCITFWARSKCQEKWIIPTTIFIHFVLRRFLLLCLWLCLSWHHCSFQFKNTWCSYKWRCPYFPNISAF